MGLFEEPATSPAAPENAPRSWPNTPEVMVLRLSAAPSIARTIGSRPEASAIARASRVLPTPESPSISTGRFAADRHRQGAPARSGAIDG